MHSKLTRTIKWLETSGHVTPDMLVLAVTPSSKKCMWVIQEWYTWRYIHMCMYLYIYRYTDIYIYTYLVHRYTLYIDIHIQRWIFHIYLENNIFVYPLPVSRTSSPASPGLPGKAEQLDGAGLPRSRIQPIKVGLSPR
jgi:hypothetical protein